MNEKLLNVKNFLIRNEKAILVATVVVTTTAVVILKSSLNQHDKFLKEHNLLEEFYSPEN